MIRIFQTIIVFAIAQGLVSNSLLSQDQPIAAERVQEYELHEELVYCNVDGKKLFVDVYEPKSEGKRPSVLVVHGGAWKRGSRRQLRGYAVELAKRGFCCFAIDYRLAPEYKFPAQIDDCREAVKWIRANAKKYNVDVKRLGVIGYSAGGHLATLLGTTGEAPSEKNGNVDTRVQAVVAGGAPTDFRWMPDNGKWAEYWMGGDLSAVPEKFKQASSAAFVDKEDAPTFFFHGEKDTLVPLIWASRCYAELKKVGVKATLYKVPGKDHRQAARDETALTKAYEFLAAELELEKEKTELR